MSQNKFQGFPLQVYSRRSMGPHEPARKGKGKIYSADIRWKMSSWNFYLICFIIQQALVSDLSSRKTKIVYSRHVHFVDFQGCAEHIKKNKHW